MPEDEADAFSPENIDTVNAITLMRIYDVLMALLTETNPQTAHDLLEMHTDGIIFGPTPHFLGTFIANAMDDGTRSYKLDEDTGPPAS